MFESISNLVLQSIEKEAVKIASASPRILGAIVCFSLFYLLSLFAVRAVKKILSSHPNLETHKNFLIHGARWAILLIGFSMTLHVLGLEKVANNILAGGGVLAAILGFAFREIGENFLAGIFLLFSRPFKLGDTIRSGDQEGVVKAIELRYTHVRSVDGKDIFIPSSQIFKDTLINHTLDGLQRPSFEIGIDYKEDLSKIIKEILEVLKSTDGIVLEKPVPGVLVSRFEGNYVILSIFFWYNSFHPTTDLVGVKTKVMIMIKEKLLESGVILSCDTSSNLSVSMVNNEAHV